MKRKLLVALLISSASVLMNQDSIAQHAGQEVAKNIVKGNRSSNYMAFSDFSSDRTNETSYPVESKADALKEVASVRSLYMSSEQYVFDNLGSLKKFFSVADIYFDLDQSAIRPDAIPVLDKLVDLMMEHPGISLATTAHADTRMSKYNEKLAMARAQSANAYLISRGIGADRLTIEKHGRPQQANPCNNDPSCSLAVQQLNRRTEFNIIYNGVNLGQIN